MMRLLGVMCLLFCCDMCAMQEEMVLNTEQIKQLSSSVQHLKRVNEELIQQNKELLEENTALHSQFCCMYSCDENAESFMSAENLRNLVSLIMVVSGCGVLGAFLN